MFIMFILFGFVMVRIVFVVFNKYALIVQKGVLEADLIYESAVSAWVPGLQSDFFSPMRLKSDYRMQKQVILCLTYPAIKRFLDEAQCLDQFVPSSCCLLINE